MKPDSTPKTESVCKHCRRPKCEHDGIALFCRTKSVYQFEPVSEPASTGEQTPKTVSLWPTCNFCGTELEKHPSGAGICPKCGAMKFGAARPFEPSTPKTGYCPSHGEKLVPIFGGQWNGCPKCPRDADGFTPSASHSPDRTTATDVAGEIDYMKSVDAAPQMSAEQWKKQCLGVGTCKCVGRCQFAPAPQPVSGDAPTVTRLPLAIEGENHGENGRIQVTEGAAQKAADQHGGNSADENIEMPTVPAQRGDEENPASGRGADGNKGLPLLQVREKYSHKLASDPAPSPTPSVSTEQVCQTCHGDPNVHDMMCEGIPPYWMVTRFETLVRMVDRGTQDTSALEEYLELRKKLREMAAPSVAGTQTTPPYTQDLPYLLQAADDVLAEQSLLNQKFTEKQNDLFTALMPWRDESGAFGAAQGTPQAEILASGLAYWFLQHWEEINAAGIYDRYLAKRDALRLTKHGVGAPAQPGPDIKKEKTMLYETSEDKLYPGSFRVEAIDQNGDGDCFVAVFDGPDAEQRATEYATWKNQPNAAPAQGTPEPPKVEEVARKLHAFLDSPTFKDSGKHPEDCLEDFLRPYFPPASQTPQPCCSECKTPVCEHVFEKLMAPIGQMLNRATTASPCEHEKLIQQQIEKRMEVLLDDNCIETIKRLTPEGGEEIFFGGVMGGIKLKWNSLATPASTARTDGQLYVISVTGDGGQTTIVPESLLKSELHKAYCSCGKDWQKCSDEVVTNTIAKLDDAEEWTQNYPSYERHIWLDHGEDYTVQVMRVSAPGSVPQAPNVCPGTHKTQLEAEECRDRHNLEAMDDQQPVSQAEPPKCSMCRGVKRVKKPDGCGSMTCPKCSRGAAQPGDAPTEKK